MWKVKVHPLVVREDFRNISAKDRKIILKTICKKLSSEPERYGAPLRHKLKGYWKLKISQYRVIYKLEKDEVRVLVLKIGMRRDQEVYREFLGRMKK